MPTLAIRDGETLVFKHVTSYTNCTALYKRTTAVDMLEGPEELSFTAEDRPEVAAVGRSGAAEGLRGRLVAAGPWPIEQEARQVTHPTNKPGPQAGLVIWWLLAALPIVL